MDPFYTRHEQQANLNLLRRSRSLAHTLSLSLSLSYHDQIMSKVLLHSKLSPRMWSWSNIKQNSLSINFRLVQNSFLIQLNLAYKMISFPL